MNISKSTMITAGVALVVGIGIGGTPPAAAPTPQIAPAAAVTTPSATPTIAPRAVDTVVAAPKPKVIYKTITKTKVITKVVKVPYLPPCKTEDSDNCIWDARKRGNGMGNSFIAYQGHIYLMKG